MRLVPIDQSATTLHEGLLSETSAAAETVRATLDLYKRRGFHPPWIGYLGIEDGTYVGGCGFASPPVGSEVEIAYFTFPGNEGRGVATRMAAELIRITRSTDGNTVTYIAHTLPQEGASTAILRKLGFALVGPIEHPEDGTVWKWSEARNAEA
jgi:[ribosomal protein S5]-alanine N-acetyltransferase